MSNIWIPNSKYKEDTEIKRKVEIRPLQDGSGLVYQCLECKQDNIVLKEDFSTNRSYSCFDCKHEVVFAFVPDDIRHFMESKSPPPIDVRPRIVRY